jgi:hypothetical protein
MKKIVKTSIIEFEGDTIEKKKFHLKPLAKRMKCEIYSNY